MNFSSRRDKLFCFISGIYSAALFYAVFLLPRRGGIQYISVWKRINFVPFRDKLYFLSISERLKYRQLYVFYTEFLGNIVLFIPFAFFLYFVFDVRSYRKIFIIGFLLSLGIEILQLIFEVGVADIDDLLLNTFGILIGILLLKLIENRKWIRKN